MVEELGQRDEINCYYPKRFEFSIQDNESVILIQNQRVFCNAWAEEGWDTERNCATQEYQYYERLVVRDFSGKLLSQEVGSLQQAQDGSWWIA